MHYYQFNIGDYISHTRHLSPIEDIAYRRLLDAYYLSERPLNSGIATVARQIGLRDYEQEVKIVLEEFFRLTDDGWINTRADKEIAKYREMVDAGKRGAVKRWLSPSDAPPNATPIATNNQEPLTNNHKPNKNTVAPPFGVTDSVWQDWVKLRKAKKAAVTQTAIDGIQREADKAMVSLQAALEMCCERGWTGFKAEWLQPKQSHGYQDKNLGAARAIFGDERNFNALQIT